MHVKKSGMFFSILAPLIQWLVLGVEGEEEEIEAGGLSLRGPSNRHADTINLFDSWQTEKLRIIQCSHGSNLRHYVIAYNARHHYQNLFSYEQTSVTCFVGFACSAEYEGETSGSWSHYPPSLTFCSRSWLDWSAKIRVIAHSLADSSWAAVVVSPPLSMFRTSVQIWLRSLGASVFLCSSSKQLRGTFFSPASPRRPPDS